jgi:predicted DNA-binding transcriptional regulator YafY
MLTRKDQLQRIFHIHQQISARKFPSVERLADHLGVDPRTIKRDIDYLRTEMQAPIKTSRHEGGYYYNGAFALLPDGLFDAHEILSLCLAYRVAATTEHTPFLHGLRNVVMKLLSLLGARDLLATFAHVSVNAPPQLGGGDEAPAHFKQLLDAINTNHQVSLRYFAMSRNEESSRTVDPLWIYYQDEQWYLLAYCHLREESTICLAFTS